MMTAKVAEEHSKVCEYRTVPCPFKQNTYMCDYKCHKTYVPGKLLEHLQEFHNQGSEMCPRKMMAARYMDSIKKRKVCKPRKSHRCGEKVASLMFSVAFCEQEDFDSFLSRRQARLYVTRHLGVMYSVYISLNQPMGNLTVLVRGDFPLTALLDNSTPPVRVHTWYPRAVTPAMYNALFEPSEKKMSLSDRQRIDRELWVDHQSKLVPHCASFTSLVEEEEGIQMNVIDLGPGQDASYSAESGHVVSVHKDEFMGPFCNPCANPECKCVAHFRVQVDFPDRA